MLSSQYHTPSKQTKWLEIEFQAQGVIRILYEKKQIPIKYHILLIHILEKSRQNLMEKRGVFSHFYGQKSSLKK